MITDGVDDYAPQYDPDDPYVLTAIKDSVRARLVVYAMYWSSRGPSAAETGIVTGRTAAENAMDTSFAAIGAGQNLLQEVTDATGGLTYWQGMGNPVSFDPFFADLRRRLQNQYLLRFDSRLEKATAVESLKVQMTAPGKITAPHQVFVESTGGAAQ
jgi:hypothetical protein